MDLRQIDVRKVVKTICLVGVWVCLGLYLEITGPTLIDLKIKTHSSYDAVSTALSGRSVGFFLGAVVGGVLVDRLGGYCDLIIALCLDGGAAATIGVPWMSDTRIIFVMTLLQGSFEGVINIAGQKLIINMWKEKSASALQILHGGFGIGSFLIPLIANPFLAVPVDEEDKNNTGVGHNSTSDIWNSTRSGFSFTSTSTPETEVVEYVKESRIQYAYMIPAAITASVSVIFFIYHLNGIREKQGVTEDHALDDKGVKKESEQTDIQTISIREMFNPATCASGNFLYGLTLFVLICLYFIQCAGGERVGGKFIRAFSIDHFGFSTDDGSLINTVYWLCFSVGRVSGFVIANIIPIRILILIETLGCLVTSICLVIFARTHQLALWVLIGFMGFFTAPLFPIGVAWGNYHMKLTGVAITIFMMGGSVGGIIYMKLIGYVYDNYGPTSFLYTLLGFSSLAFGIAIIMDLVGSIHGNRFHNVTEAEEKVEKL